MTAKKYLYCWSQKSPSRKDGKITKGNIIFTNGHNNNNNNNNNIIMNNNNNNNDLQVPFVPAVHQVDNNLR